MNCTLKLISGLMLCLLATQLGAQNNWVRTPAISPDGTKIAFSYQGDIWTANADGSEARRMTVHEAYESNPQFSPNGEKILFVGNRFGNNDLYELSASGNVNRLTYHSTYDINGRYDQKGNILFNTRRLNVHVEREPEVQILRKNMGTPEQLFDGLGFNPAASADGRYIAFERGSCRIERETYRGPAQRDIWIYDTNNQSYSQLTTDEGQDIFPNWSSDGFLYFLSARGGKYNIYRQKVDGTSKEAPKKISSFKEDGIRYFNISSNGKYAIIELADELRLMDLKKGGKGNLISLDLPKDSRYDSYVHKTFRNGLGEYSISPDGKKMAATVRGEIFVFENNKENKITKNISNSPYRDQGAEWLNDTTVLFMSDRSGERDLYMVTSSDTSRTCLLKSYKLDVTKVRDTENDMTSFLLSPDRSKIVLRDGRGKMSVADISDSTGIQNEIILLDSWATPSGVSWSPDSEWLAYSKSDLDFNSEIYIHKADGSSDPINVSMHPRSDVNPVWSPDGSKLGFESIRNNGDSDLWFAWLKTEDWERTDSEWEMMDDKSDKSDSIVVDIDVDNIYRRLVQVTSMAGNERNLTISKDGETFLFTTNGGGRSGSGGKSVLMSVKWDGSDLKELNRSGNIYGLSYDPSSSKYYYLMRGNIYKSDKGSKGDKISITAKMDIVKYEERAQIFDEAWRALNDGFYDPQFHGQDFEALKNKYRPRALAASTPQEFRLQFNEMIGQLDASHMGMYGSNPEETQKERTGLIGAVLASGENGFKVSSVVPGSPADREESKLNIGDRILSINGKLLSGKENFYLHMEDLANTKVLLEVEDQTGKAREVLISPVSSLRTVLYDAWVSERRRLTEEYSGGKLGYIHIRGMNWPSFENFERELMASGYGKEGIVIDVRFNGGGWTTDMMMAVLNVRQHSYTVPRGAVANLEKDNKKFVNNYPYGERLPLSSWTKPSIALCNQNSYSNAEIFSHAFKTLGHGKLVGVPTFGAVISTGGKGLIDGSYVRMPFRAWYVKATGENMEHGPAVPDVILYNAPDSKSKGIDEQLEKAVDLLLEDL
jgi:tricorn protease